MPQPELSEEELLQRAGRGDVRAFNQFHDAVAPRLFGLLRQMMPDGAVAEEALVDGFVQVWERASGFDPAHGSAFTWAVTLVRQQAIERMRILGRRNRLLDAAVLEQATLSAPVAEELANERSAAVGEALKQLPKEQRRLIEMAFLKGLTGHVLSESLEQPITTVKTQIRGGLLRLRDLLKGGV